MRIAMNSSSVNMAGMGPVAWDRDEQKVSMHPPIPGHIEFVEDHLEQRAHKNGHHIVHRRNPDADESEEILIPHEVRKEDFQRTPHPHLNHIAERHKNHTAKRAKQSVRRARKSAKMSADMGLVFKHEQGNEYPEQC